jgi:hypothetical protein
LGDAIWTMADPASAVPRDPLTVIADVSGSVQLFVSLMGMDPTQMDAPPGELRALNLNELRVFVGGAELTGTGAMEFAAGQMVPIPVEQIAVVRGMLGAFTRPGAMPDTMETAIEFAPGGMITANGVPLQ